MQGLSDQAVLHLEGEYDGRAAGERPYVGGPLGALAPAVQLEVGVRAPQQPHHAVHGRAAPQQFHEGELLAVLEGEELLGLGRTAALVYEVPEEHGLSAHLGVVLEEHVPGEGETERTEDGCELGLVDVERVVAGVRGIAPGPAGRREAPPLAVPDAPEEAPGQVYVLDAGVQLVDGLVPHPSVVALELHTNPSLAPGSSAGSAERRAFLTSSVNPPKTSSAAARDRACSGSWSL